MKTNWTIPSRSPSPSIQQRAKAKRLLFCAALCGLLCCSVVPTAFGQFQFQRLKSFGFPELSAAHPWKLIEGNDGRLYGTTAWGAGKFGGSVFALEKNGSGLTVLHWFGSTEGDGLGTLASLVQGSDGALYGTTDSGGAYGADSWGSGGTVFKLNSDGSGYRVLRSFGGENTNGSSPRALVAGSDGRLYGISWGEFGEPAVYGWTVFTLNRDGSGYSALHSFEAGIAYWKLTESPLESLAEGTDGMLYGTTVYGANNGGTVFKLTKNGNYTVLHTFEGADDLDGERHPTGVIEGSDGSLYGTTAHRGINGGGTVFKLNKDGSGYRTLHSFIGGYNSGGAHPYSGLVEGSDGALYGTTASGGTNGGGTVFKLNRDGSGHTVLRGFTGSDGDGSHPHAGLVKGSDGALYGATLWGGNFQPSSMGMGAGTAFKLNQDGSGYAVLRRFLLLGGGDGSVPYAMVVGSDSMLYGMTGQGGSEDAGTVFKLRKDGSDYTLLHTFTFTGGGGSQPFEGLVEGRDGLLYGTTGFGGTADAGTVFKLNKDGSGYSRLHNFMGTGGDGQEPRGMIEARDGVLYGVTHEGGITNSTYTRGLGTLFKLNKNGSGYVVLHRFGTAAGDGRHPFTTLLEDNDGTLFGNTGAGGSADLGTVFRLNKDGSGYTVLRRFTGLSGDGREPHGLLIDSDGLLYGTTSSGGAHDRGTVFRLKKDGSDYTVIRSFGSSTGGEDRPGALVEGIDGALYGTLRNSASGEGVFRLNKAGSGYAMVLNGFTQWGGYYIGALATASDGALYAATHSGGDMGLGTIFALRPQAVMLPPIISGVGVTVRFSSVLASTHRLQRAGTLDGSWMTLTNLVVPTGGVAEFTDPAPPQPGGFYRTATP